LNKKVLIVLTVFLLVSILPYAALAASSADSFPDAIGISPKDYNECKLYSEPDLKGEILDFMLYESSEYFADSTPIVNKINNSQWYKVVYFLSYGDSILRQINKLSDFNNNNFYVRADDVTTNQAGDYVKNQIEWLRDGRPPHHKVGDTFKFDELRIIDNSVIIELTAPATLVDEPKEGARTIDAPKGLKCLGPLFGTEDFFPVIAYADMEEENWALIIDIKTSEVLGWIKTEQLSKISEQIEPNIP
jgi:hypothetical protein